MATKYKEDPANKTVELTVDGKVTKDDFNRISGQMESFISAHGTIKMIEIIDNFEGFDPSVILDGIKFDIRNLKHISHCAVVTDDSSWVSSFIKAASAINNAAKMPCKVKTFNKTELNDAKTWLRRQNSP